ncbi:MAG: sodium:calcium symporter [Aquificota bacterium]|jgi:SNF family Na+-dependent transporter
MGKREHWQSRIGLILAMAGNAVGLGNFLRFPNQATEHGGGAFMIPYLIAFLIVGIPLMWTEWAMGRLGGSKGHGTTPAIFYMLWPKKIAKYLGVLGIWIPLVVATYYVYIESWTLGFSVQYLLGLAPKGGANIDNPSEYLKPFVEFLYNYIGYHGGLLLEPSFWAYVFFIITFLINLYILYKGISGGIEKFVKWAMPTLFIIAVVLAVRVLTLEIPTGQIVLKAANESVSFVSDKGQIDITVPPSAELKILSLSGDKLIELRPKEGKPQELDIKISQGRLEFIIPDQGEKTFSYDTLILEVKGNITVKGQSEEKSLKEGQYSLAIPKRTAVQGLDFLWNPDWSKLKDPNVWIAAVGQIFFTLSLGFGAIITYASYVRRNQDIALSGLAAASLNETAEVILGASIAIPAAVAFFGVANAVMIAKGGAFNLGFVSLPAIFSNIEAGQFFGFLWFFLLFIAGVTSSVAILQPMIAFLEDEFGFDRKTAVTITSVIVFIGAQAVIFLAGFLDEMDFWAGTFFVIVLGLLEVILFYWIYDAKKAWEEINRGGLIQVPRIYFYIVRYITPLFLLALLIGFVVNEIFGKSHGQTPITVWLARFYLVALYVFLAILVFIADKRQEKQSSN